jgi:imidazolonepropionase-like amidohydrolase
MPPVLVELAQRNLTEGAKSMRAARDAGVKIALGSDTRLAAGLELQRMIHHGLTPDEALVAATRTAAEALGLDEYIGTVAEGKLADLIVVDGDPLHEPQVLSDPERIWLVLQLGEPVAGQYLANPALFGQFVSPDRPAAPQPSDMEGWAARSRAAQ